MVTSLKVNGLEKRDLEAVKIGQILDRMMIAWTIPVIFLTPNLRTFLYTCFGTDLFDKKPNFYNLAQL